MNINRFAAVFPLAATSLLPTVAHAHCPLDVDCPCECVLIEAVYSTLIDGDENCCPDRPIPWEIVDPLYRDGDY
jgi:hypothetical protein